METVQNPKNPQESQRLEKTLRFENLKKITPLSKYLAMALFVILPFVGGFVGYMLAPEQVVEVERVVVEEKIVEKSVLTSDRGRRVFVKVDIPEGWRAYSREEGEPEYGTGEVRYSDDSDSFLLSHRTFVISQDQLEGPSVHIRKFNMSREQNVEIYTSMNSNKDMLVEQIELKDREVIKTIKDVPGRCREVKYYYSFLDDLGVSVETSGCAEESYELAESLEFDVR